MLLDLADQCIDFNHAKRCLHGVEDFFCALPAPMLSFLPLKLLYLRAPAGLREELAWIEQLAGIPRLAYLLHDAQIERAKNQGHLLLLLYAHAMFTCDAAACLGADLQNFVSRPAHALDLAGHLGVEEDQWMQVAIAGVEDVAHAQSIAGADLAHAPQDVGQAGARHNPILHVKLRANASHSPESIFASSPKSLAFLFIGGNAQRAGVMFLADAHNLLDLLTHALLQTLGFHQQHSRGIQRIARM